MVSWVRLSRRADDCGASIRRAIRAMTVRGRNRCPLVGQEAVTQPGDDRHRLAVEAAQPGLPHGVRVGGVPRASAKSRLSQVADGPSRSVDDGEAGTVFGK